MTLKIKPVRTAPIESVALTLRSCRVKSVITTAATSGRKRIIQASISAFIGSKLHRHQVLHVGRLALALERYNERQANGHLGRCHCDDEKDKDLPVQIVIEPREGDQRQVRRIQHQLERHVDDKQIAPHDDPQQANTEQNDADYQIVFESDVRHFRSFLLSKTTPTMATSSSTETISNGSKYCVNSSLPSGIVPPSSAGTWSTPSGEFARPLRKMARIAPTEITPVKSATFLIFRRSSALRSSCIITN